MPDVEDLRAQRDALLARADLGGSELRAELTRVADRWLGALLTDAAGGDLGGLTLVAVGGYGRADPAPYSDLDLVLVHRDRSDVAGVADKIWYPVWDTGVGLDHSVRTVSEAVSVAGDDLKAALGLLDARHVAGDTDLSGELRAKTLGAWRASASKRLPELVEATRKRGAEQGEAAFLLEPDLKESRGGLRDVIALRAAAASWVVDIPGDRLRQPHGVLLDVRGELHRRAGRATERLLLQEQDAVATALGYADADELLAAVSGAARTIAFSVDEAWRRVEAWLPSTSKSRWRPGRNRSPESARRPLADGVVEQNGEVVLARDADPSIDPALVFRVGAAAAERELPVARHALDRLAAESAPIPEPWPGSVRNAFLAMLGAGRGTVPVVDALDQAGLFARHLPEWEHVRFRPQRNAVHRFTVDRHLIETTVEAGLLARDVGRPDLLLLGALLHDIGKGQPGDHTDAGVVMTQVIAPRLGLTAQDADTVVALVRNHLLLPDTATRRDIDDPATVEAVAAAVDGSRQTLELLHALTEADAMATGPAAWSDWKASLISELVRRTNAVLAGDPPPTEPVLSEAQRAQADRRQLDVVAEAGSAPGSWTVTVTAPDRPGLLWRAAGVLALHRLDVHAATATSVDTVAVSVFTVSPVFGAVPDWRLVRDDLRAALDGNLPLADRLAERERAYAGARTHRPAPPRVILLDDASASSTVVEVRAHDSAGLLHRIGRALEGCELNIRTARVSTLGAEAVDVFYVVDRTGAKLTDPGEREKVEAAILAGLGD